MNEPWQSVVYHDRRNLGNKTVDAAIENSKRWAARHVDKEGSDWLASHGYCEWAAARGVAGGPDIFLARFSYEGGPIYLRNRVCQVDGHESSDIDPSYGCIHCQHRLSDEDDE